VPDLRDLDALAHGSPTQRRALAEWRALDVAGRLAQFDPVLVSTLASGLDVDGSDLDVACYSRDPSFAAALRDAYGERPGFSIWRSGERTTAKFDGPTLAVEIFGEPQPVEQQAAYLHALAARRLVALGGEGFAAAVKTARIEQGLKTEPAIAAVLGLDGDPYERVRQLADAPDDALRQCFRCARSSSGGGALR
jgi:hypothetical protein